MPCASWGDVLVAKGMASSDFFSVGVDAYENAQPKRDCRYGPNGGVLIQCTGTIRNAPNAHPLG